MTRYLPLVLLSSAVAIAAVVPLSARLTAPTVTSLSLTQPLSAAVNVTDRLRLPANLHAFPIGPPPPKYYFDIPGTDVSLEVNVFGLTRGRDEKVVKNVLNKAFEDSLDPYRPHEAMSEDGIHYQEGIFLLGVQPSSHMPGEKPFTWGMWAETLTGLYGYVRAYPGYDVNFDVWYAPRDGRSQKFVIAAGLAYSRP